MDHASLRWKGPTRVQWQKQATFTADFRAYRAISGDPHKIKTSSQYMLLYFLLDRFVSKSYYKLNNWLLWRCYFRVTFNCLNKYEKSLSQFFFFIRLNCLIVYYLLSHFELCSTLDSGHRTKKMQTQVFKNYFKNSILFTFIVSFLLLYEDDPFWNV